MDYLIPKLREQVAFSSTDVIFTVESISYILNQYTIKEDGVRNLKRCLEIIFTKLNLCRLLKSDTDVIKHTKFEYPLTITNDVVDKLLKRDESIGMHMHMYI
jgi:ATP-dependent Lon protease